MSVVVACPDNVFRWLLGIAQYRKTMVPLIGWMCIYLQGKRLTWTFECTESKAALFVRSHFVVCVHGLCRAPVTFCLRDESFVLYSLMSQPIRPLSLAASIPTILEVYDLHATLAACPDTLVKDPEEQDLSDLAFLQ